MGEIGTSSIIKELLSRLDRHDEPIRVLLNNTIGCIYLRKQSLNPKKAAEYLDRAQDILHNMLGASSTIYTFSEYYGTELAFILRPKFHYYCARLFEVHGEFENAQEKYRKIFSLGLADLDWYRYKHIKFLISQGKILEARKTFEEIRPKLNRLKRDEIELLLPCSRELC